LFILNVEIKDYKNETLIENLPYGHIYTFRVGILDNITKIFYNSSESARVDFSLSKSFFLE